MMQGCPRMALRCIQARQLEDKEKEMSYVYMKIVVIKDDDGRCVDRMVQQVLVSVEQEDADKRCEALEALGYKFIGVI